jgi:hypothetical protein
MGVDFYPCSGCAEVGVDFEHFCHECHAHFCERCVDACERMTPARHRETFVDAPKRERARLVARVRAEVRGETSGVEVADAASDDIVVDDDDDETDKVLFCENCTTLVEPVQVTTWQLLEYALEKACIDHAMARTACIRANLVRQIEYEDADNKRKADATAAAESKKRSADDAKLEDDDDAHDEKRARETETHSCRDGCENDCDGSGPPPLGID